MKKINILLKSLVVVVLFGAFSCSDYLEEKNWSSQTADNLFSTSDGFESLVNGAYSSLRSVYNNKNYLNLTWLGTDIITQSSYDSASALNQYTVNFQNDESSCYNYWVALYGALKNCNAVIDRADKADITADTRKQRVAEAKALRALWLFELVRNYGDVPLMIHEASTVQFSAERDSAEEIYKQIIEDLNEAVSVLPARQTGSNYGRFSSSAAQHLRALVYLTRGYQTYGSANDFTSAYNDATSLIQSTTSGHSLLNDFGAVHRQSNEENTEILLAVQFNTNATYGIGNTLNKYFIFPYREGYLGGSKDSYYGNDDGTFMPTKYLYMLFDWKKDSRARVTFMSAYNGDTKTSVDGRDAGKNWMQATAAVSGKYAVGDATILFPTPAYSATPSEELVKESTITKNYPSGDPDDFSADGEGNDYWVMGATNTSNVSRTWLPVWKFRDANSYFLESGASTGTRDTYLFRLAETYLIASEAALKKGDNPNALKYLNDIRQRAEINPGDLVYPDGTTVTIDMILDERALELFGESSRWNDLQRTGKLVERVRAHNWDVNNITGGKVQTQLTDGSTKYYLRPIPLTWLNSLRNGSELSNNPGWE